MASSSNSATSDLLDRSQGLKLPAGASCAPVDATPGVSHARCRIPDTGTGQSAPPTRTTGKSMILREFNGLSMIFSQKWFPLLRIML
jgi:hypothetical protein